MGAVGRGTFRVGDRLPSVRGLSRQMRVSVSTVMEAYRLLEDSGRIEARPQSGHQDASASDSTRCAFASALIDEERWVTVVELGRIATMMLDAGLAVAALAALAALALGAHRWRLLFVLLGAGIIVIGIDVSTRDPDLEDVFLSLVAADPEVA